MDLDYLKEKSNSLNEAIDVGMPVDEIINAVIEQKQYSSLAYQIAEVAPIHGPTAATFALVFEGGKVKLKRGEVTVESDALEDTEFTVEALQDLFRQYGKSMVGYIGKVFAGISSLNENRKLIAKLSSFATASPDLVLTDAGNAETAIFEIQQRVAELVLEINSSSFKSLDSFVILPKKVAASMLAVSNRLPENKREYGLFIGSNSRTDFYLNPDVNSTECFVGIKSTIPGQSSVIFSPYVHQLQVVTNPKDGQQKIFNYNRYAITESKLSEYQSMLYKFEIA